MVKVRRGLSAKVMEIQAGWGCSQPMPQSYWKMLARQVKCLPGKHEVMDLIPGTT